MFLCDARATGDRLEGRGNPIFGKARQRSLTSKTPRRHRIARDVGGLQPDRRDRGSRGLRKRDRSSHGCEAFAGAGGAASKGNQKPMEGEGFGHVQQWTSRSLVRPTEESLEGERAHPDRDGRKQHPLCATSRGQGPRVLQRCRAPGVNRSIRRAGEPVEAVGRMHSSRGVSVSRTVGSGCWSG